VTADPLFVDWQADDFQLQPRSPAKKLNAGSTYPALRSQR
jgi:hypothetical protein